MRFGVWIPLLAAALTLAAPALAGQGTAPLGNQRPDIGRLEIRTQTYGQALGVIARMVRPLGAEVECNGICYFPSSTRPTAWRCAPKAQCELHCDVNPPVGGCD